MSDTENKEPQAGPSVIVDPALMQPEQETQPAGETDGTVTSADDFTDKDDDLVVPRKPGRIAVMVLLIILGLAIGGLAFYALLKPIPTAVDALTKHIIPPGTKVQVSVPTYDIDASKCQTWTVEGDTIVFKDCAVPVVRDPTPSPKR